MADSEYNIDNYKSSKINTGAVTKNPKTFKFVPDHLRI